MSVPILAAGVLMSLVAILFVLSALALIFIVLLQKGRGGGLSAALGGGMASGILGAKTGDVLTWVTISLVGVFLVLAVLMTKYWRPQAQQYGTQPAAPTRQSQPVTPSQPAPEATLPAPSAAQPSAPATGQPVPADTASAPAAAQPSQGASSTPSVPTAEPNR